jgi:hypothetical protein
VVAPHEGVADFDTVAGAAYGRIRCPNIIILIGPNHREIAEPVAQAMEHKDRSVGVPTGIGRRQA